MRETITSRSGHVLELPTADEEALIQAGIEADPDNPELTSGDFAWMRPAREVFDAATMAGLVALKSKTGAAVPTDAPTSL